MENYSNQKRVRLLEGPSKIKVQITLMYKRPEWLLWLVEEVSHRYYNLMTNYQNEDCSSFAYFHLLCVIYLFVYLAIFVLLFPFLLYYFPYKFLSANLLGGNSYFIVVWKFECMKKGVYKS